MGEKEERSGSCAAERGTIEEMKAVGRMMWGEACLSPWAMVTFGPELLSRTMSRSMVLTQPASVRALTVQVATKVQRDA